MCNMRRIGSKIDPCGTPHSIHKKDDETLFIDTYRYRLDKSIYSLDNVYLY